MTLIIDYQTLNFAISISDRVVSVGDRPYHTRFNKAIFVLTSDAIFVISFTGNALIEGISTDEWLARTIMENAEKEIYHTRLNTERCGPATIKIAVSRVLCGLRRMLKTNLKSGINVEIIFSGLRLRNRLIIPFRTTFKTKSGCADVVLGGRNSVSTINSYYPYFLDFSGGWNIRRYLYNELFLELSKDPENVDHVIISCLVTLEKFASEYPSIGAEAMVITTRLNDDSKISFSPLREYPPELLIPRLDWFGRISYSPWIISPTSFSAPMRYSGGLTFESGRRANGSPVKVLLSPTPYPEESEVKLFITHEPSLPFRRPRT